MGSSVNASWLHGLDVVASAAMSREKTGLVRAVFLEPEALPEAAARLDEAGYFLEDLSVVDTSEGFLVVYHFDHFETPGRVALRVLVPHERPVVPSISGFFSGADWHERECRDFFGITFTGHPNLIPLLLPEDSDIHPLVKEESARKRLAELIAPGDVEKSSAAFEALFAPLAPPEAEAEAKEGGEGAPGSRPECAPREAKADPGGEKPSPESAS
jgi:NADH-quinone oxidoreductase subunit C